MVFSMAVDRMELQFYKHRAEDLFGFLRPANDIRSKEVVVMDTNELCRREAHNKRNNSTTHHTPNPHHTLAQSQVG